MYSTKQRIRASAAGVPDPSPAVAARAIRGAIAANRPIANSAHRCWGRFEREHRNKTRRNRRRPLGHDPSRDHEGCRNHPSAIWFQTRYGASVAAAASPNTINLRAFLGATTVSSTK